MARINSYVASALMFSLTISGAVKASTDPITADQKTGANFNRYHYANNNPYKFKDPDGRHTCAGSSTDCDSVAKAVQKVAISAGNLPQGSKEQQALNAVVNFYGPPGVDNGVSVRVGSQNSLPGAAGGAVTIGGRTTIGIPMNVIARDAGSMEGEKFEHRLGGVVAHEGDHGVSQRRDGMPSNRATMKAHEIRGNMTEAAFYQGLNSSHGPWLWLPSSGVQFDGVERAAEWSTNKWCAAGKSC